MRSSRVGERRRTRRRPSLTYLLNVLFWLEPPPAIHFILAMRINWDNKDKNVTRAVVLYECAAELGFQYAHYILGFLYSEGTDVEKDTAKAFRHYDAAATCGQAFDSLGL